jgi:PhoH-like ATPase
MDVKNSSADAEEVFGSEKIDHRILNAALGVQFENPDKKVILVSKDICLRLKAKALNLYAEDYETGKVKNIDELYSGKTVLNKVTEKLLGKLNKSDSLPADDFDIQPQSNQFFVLNSKNGTASAFYNKQTGQVEKGYRAAGFEYPPAQPGTGLCHTCPAAPGY